VSADRRSLLAAKAVLVRERVVAAAGRMTEAGVGLERLLTSSLTRSLLEYNIAISVKTWY
jgi:hypothetical protein